MSVYKHKDSPFYHFDFQFKGDRFHGSTGCKSKREAEAFERDERDRAKQVKRATSAVSTQLDYVAGRYWNEIGQHHAGADTTWRDNSGWRSAKLGRDWCHSCSERRMASATLTWPGYLRK